MRLAAIDIGTNSLHMIVVQVRPDLSFEVIDREKEMVRLGAGGLDGRALTTEAMDGALLALSKFRRLAESHQVDTIIAAATSATREAENGPDFLEAVERDTGIRVRVISGTEEARLIHLAAAYGVGAPGEVAVVVDIGGGSVEVTRGMGREIDSGRSFKLGVIRLTERFVKSDPLAPRDERRLVKYIEAEAGGYLDEVREAGFDRVIGTSGTILSLGAIVRAQQGERSADAQLRNQRVNARILHRVRKDLAALPLADRLRVPGLEPRRADLCVAGAVLLDTVVRRLGAGELVLCDLSLREGLVLDYIDQHRREIAQVDRYPDIRRRSVIELAERSNYVASHARHVAHLSLELFDRTRAIHGLTDRERECLEYAALLHDIGVQISFEKHHRHTEYMIQHGDLRGFEPMEVTLMALIARYHRRSEPSKGQRAFRELPRDQRKAVRALAAMLRLAESLDRSHSQPIQTLDWEDRGPDILLTLRTTGDAELEAWSATRHAGAFQGLVGKPLRFEVVPLPQPAAKGQARRSVTDDIGRRRGHRPAAGIPVAH